MRGHPAIKLVNEDRCPKCGGYDLQKDAPISVSVGGINEMQVWRTIACLKCPAIYVVKFRAYEVEIKP